MKKTPKLLKIQLGIYKHYKGNLYKIIGVARHSETLEEFVVYQALYAERSLWIRPYEMFTGNVELDGKVMPRFKYIKSVEDQS